MAIPLRGGSLRSCPVLPVGVCAGRESGRVISLCRFNLGHPGGEIPCSAEAKIAAHPGGRFTAFAERCAIPEPARRPPAIAEPSPFLAHKNLAVAIFRTGNRNKRWITLKFTIHNPIAVSLVIGRPPAQGRNQGMRVIQRRQADGFSLLPSSGWRRSHQSSLFSVARSLGLSTASSGAVNALSCAFSGMTR